MFAGVQVLRLPGLLAAAVLLLASHNPMVNIERRVELKVENFKINEQELEHNANLFLEECFDGMDSKTLYELPISDDAINGLWKQFSYEREHAIKKYEAWFKGFAKQLWDGKRAQG